MGRGQIEQEMEVYTLQNRTGAGSAWNITSYISDQAIIENNLDPE